MVSTILSKQTFKAQPGTTFTTGDVNNNIFYGNGISTSMSGVVNTVGLGRAVFSVLTSGTNNTAFGNNTLQSVTSGSNNTSFGSQALKGITTGSDNVGFGMNTINVVTTGNKNTCLGAQVAVAMTTSSSNNTFIGFGTGAGTNTIVNNTTLIGKSALTGNFSNSTAINTNATCTAANQVILGTTSDYVHFPGTTSNGSILLVGTKKINKSRTTINGSVSGNILVNMIHQGTAFKKVIIYLNALNGTASYTFPTAFTNTPAIVVNSNTGGLTASVVTSLSTTAVTITGATQTGFIFLEGY